MSEIVEATPKTVLRMERCLECGKPVATDEDRRDRADECEELDLEAICFDDCTDECPDCHGAELFYDDCSPSGEHFTVPVDCPSCSQGEW